MEGRVRALSLAAAFFAAACVGPEKPDPTGTVENFTLDSALVGDSFRIWVRLPQEYDGSRRFPLVVQLDANLPTLEEFWVTAGWASRLEKDTIGPVIVAGIGVDSDPYGKRLRDFSMPLEHPDDQFPNAGGAPAFLRFIGEELLPHLEQKYVLAGPDKRALFGHSMGGLFVAYALSQQQNSARLFRGYVAASPALWWDGGTINRYFDALLVREPDAEAELLLTAGSIEGPEINVYADDFAERLQAKAPPGLAFENVRYETMHIGSVQPSFVDGLVNFYDRGVLRE
jgi:predicted alpha/beta superfamily hydrolase